MRLNLAVRPPYRHTTLLTWLVTVVVLVGSGAWGSAVSVRLAAARHALAGERVLVTGLQAQLRAAEVSAAPHRRAQAIAASLNRDAVDLTVLRRIESVAPADLWLTSADLARGRLVLNGQAISWTSAAAFTERLAHVPGVSQVELRSLQVRGRAEGYDFTISAEAGRPAGETLP